jgi:methionyl-tRNA formyltransferase
MNVLYYTNSNKIDDRSITDIIKSYNDNVFVHVERVELDIIEKYKIDYIVSDRSKFLIKKQVLDQFQNKIINIHPSFLPWGRGYYPNYWSIKNNLPFGTTIHFIDEGIDTGNIISQIRLTPSKNDTLRTSYERLRSASINLFDVTWKEIKNGISDSYKQNLNEGSLHYKNDFKGVLDNLVLGWDTPIRDINNKFK